MQLIEDIEMCPKGWTLTTVGDACNICDNLRLPLNVEQRQLMQGEFPYYGPTGVLDYLNEFRLDGTYALIGEDGDHFLKFWDWPMTQLVNGKFNVNNHAHIVQGKGDCLTEWFYLYFHHMCLRPVLTLQGVGRYKLTRQGLERLPIIVPPVREQKKLVAIIREWTQAANTLSKLIDAKVRFKQGLMQQLLTGKRRFPEFGKPADEADRLPEGWQRLKASELFGNFTQKNNDGEDLLSVTQDRGVIPRTMLEGKVVMPESGTDGYKLVEPGDFVISLRSFQGGLEYSQYRGLVSPAYTVLKPRQTINDAFFRHYFKSYDFIQRLAVAVFGIRDGKQISYSDFESVKLPNPPLKEQERIAGVLDIADKELELLSKQLDFLKQQKKGLMQKLLTGEVRVKL